MRIYKIILETNLQYLLKLKYAHTSTQQFPNKVLEDLTYYIHKKIITHHTNNLVVNSKHFMHIHV